MTVSGWGIADCAPHGKQVAGGAAGSRPFAMIKRVYPKTAGGGEVRGRGLGRRIASSAHVTSIERTCYQESMGILYELF